MSKLGDALGLKRPAPMTPKFQPKLRIRVGNDRSLHVSEFAIEIPVTGFSLEAAARCQEILAAILKDQGIIPETTVETDDAKGNVRPEESQSEGSEKGQESSGDKQSHKAQAKKKG